MKKSDQKLSQEIGRNLKSLRQKINWNQQQVAEKLGISIPAYSKIETGITDINMSRLKQICNLYEVDISSIIPEDNNNNTIQKLTDKNESLTQELLVARRNLTDLQGKAISLYEEVIELRRKRDTSHLTPEDIADLLPRS